MKILDAHMHLGEDCVFDEVQTEQDILETTEKYGVAGGIIQPFIPRMYVRDTMEIHDRIWAMCRAHPGRFHGMMSMNPHFSPEDYEAEADRCMRKLGFVGIKITPIAHAAHPGKKDCLFACEMARKHNVPVMIHTGAGVPFADPMQMVKAVEGFPDVRFVIAHGGTDNMCSSAIYLASKYDNVFVEPSWLAIHNLEGMYHRLGASKMMFSSDMCVNLPVELCKYNLVFQKEEDREQVFHRTLETVFAIGG
ncbi:MAG: amidohydrolase family protein [Clostridiales bacterium]|nr:amidohydrolase family protein [Clostridiales bacterium]